MPPPGVCQSIMDARQKQDGYGTLTNPERFLKQDYKHLKEYCMIRNVKFIDESFPPDRKSIGPEILNPTDLDQVEWLRPEKMSPNPAFVLDGVSRFDFGQGFVGNCWFLASIGALTFQRTILQQVVPLEQTFDRKNYCGLFHFRFWRFGRWVDVIIDDKLPTINGKLIFVHSKDKNEFWPALMEKAYAKVCGSYSDMKAGTPAEAMRDFTGGVYMCIELSKATNLWELLCRAGKSKTLMSCGTRSREKTDDKVLPNGLVPGHAYTVTGLKQIMSQGKLVNLVRLWNPWGKTEWNGDWSDRSSLWQTVSPSDREKFRSLSDDGEFWMTIEDLCKCFVDIDICGLSPDFIDGNPSSQWKTSMYEGRWVAGTTAGGCIGNTGSFWTNPQYRIKVCGKYSEKSDVTNILVSLMQKPDKWNRRLVQNLYIGVAIFEVTEQDKTQSGKFPASFFSSQKLVAQTKTYMNTREVMEFLMLKPGEYVIIPSTYQPNESASFILTILSKDDTHCYENSGYNLQESTEKIKKPKNKNDNENKKAFFRQYSDKYEEVDAEQLQKLLNETILKGDLKSGGFSIDACRSMVALMDSSVTGKLNSEEFVRLWNKVMKYKEVFHLTDVDKTGTLSLSELRNAFIASELKVSDEMLNLMALRYGASSGHMTLESFISLILRLDCMLKIFRQLCDGKAMKLVESEWLCISMYT
ncbi:calpain-A [Nematolebias whitei]|uniref:calpain-A n=1 Tax=Nematolebias whitei TaxID=451745 RepID=UPI0018985D3A|nr:calpain-A [Nematolebias whitei]